MANKKRQIISFSVVSVLLVIALVLSLTAVMGAGRSYDKLTNNDIRKAVASVKDTAPLADGEVASGYQPSGNTQVGSISDIRGNAGGNLNLSNNITVNSIDGGTTFLGTLDGCGHTITINAVSTSSGEVFGGLFAYLNGTIKNVKIIVEKFSVSTGSAGERSIGIIAGQINGGTVENVSIEFRYSPTNVESNSGDAYFLDNGVHTSGFASGRDNWLCFGGVAGVGNNATIKNVTTINNTTGDYGISTYCSVAKGGWSSSGASTGVAAGMIIGHTKSGNTCTLENITLKRGVGGSYTGKMSLIQSATNGASSSCESGLVFGKNAGTLNINGVIIDDSYFQGENFFDQLVQKGNNSTQYFGSLVGTGMDTSRVKNIIASTDPGWMDGRNNALQGVINSSDLDFIAFDKGENSGNVILKTTYQRISDESIKAFVDFAGTRTNILQMIINTEKAGQDAYISVAKSDAHSGSVSYVNATKGNALIEYSTNESGQYDLGTKEYDAQAFAPVVKVGDNSYTEMWNCINNSGNAGTYVFDLDLRNKTLSNHQFIIDGDTKAFIDYTNAEIYYLTYSSTQAVGTINPKNLELQWSNTTLTYSGTQQGPSVYVEGVDGKPINMSIEGNMTDVGTGYVATASMFIPNSNYVIANPTCEYSIVPMVLGGNFAFADDNVYSGSDKEAVFTLTSGQLFNEDKISIEYAEGTDRKNAGTFSLTAKVPSTNYTFAEGETSFAGELEIVAKDINLVVEGKTREYNGQVEDLSVYPVSGVDGFVASDNVVITVSTQEENSANVGSYTLVITTSADENANYNITRTEGAVLQITPYKVVIEQKADAQLSHDYNEGVVNEADLFEVPQGLEGALKLSFVTTNSQNQTSVIKNADTYKVVASLAEGQTNYVADSVELSYTVNKKVLVIGTETNPENLQSVYNGEALTKEQMKALFTAPLDSKDAAFELNVSAEGEVKNAGTYAITAEIVISEEEKANYTCENAVVEYTVNQAVIDGSIVLPEDLEYDGTQKTADFQITEGVLYGNDQITLTYTNGEVVESAINAGTYTVSVALPEYEDGKSNYKFAETVVSSVEMVIAPMSVEISAKEAMSKTYDGVAVEDFAAMFNIPQDKDGMALQYDYTIAKGEESVSEIKNAGEYTITATLRAGQGNYTSNTATATYTINKVAVDGKLVFDNMAYNGKEKTASFEFAGESPMVGSDQITISYGEGDRTNVGAVVSVTANLPSYENYKFAPTAVYEGAIEVTPVRLEVDFGEYGNTEKGLTVVKGESFSISAKILGTDGANVQIGDTSYAYTINATWRDIPYMPSANVGDTFIIKVEITITDLNATNYVYDKEVSLKVIATPIEGNFEAENDGVVYDGNAYGAVFQPTTGGVTEADYQIEYALLGTDDWTTEKPVNAGTYKARVVSLNESYSDERIEEITFVINKAEANVNPEIADGKYFEGYLLPEISLGEGSTEGTIVWTNGEEKLVAGSHEYSWTFTSSNPNYNDASGTIAIEAQAVVFDHIVVEKTENFKTEYTYGDTFDKSGIIVKAVNNDDTFVVLGAEEYTVDKLLTGATSVNVSYNQSTVAVDGFVVNKKVVEVPAINDDGFVYNGEEYKVSVEENSFYTIGGQISGVNAGEYKVSLTLTDNTNYKWAESEEATIEVVWTIAKATREIKADFDVDYKSVKVMIDGDTNLVQYSLDGKTFANLDGDTITVDFAKSYTIYFKYAESENYLESAALKVEKNVSKKALAGYIDDSFGDTFTFGDIAKYNEVLAMAESAYGDSEEYDTKIAELTSKYNALIDNAKENAQEAIDAGSILAGKKAVATAVALTLTSAFAGVGLVAMSLKVRKGGKKND